MYLGVFYKFISLPHTSLTRLFRSCLKMTSSICSMVISLRLELRTYVLSMQRDYVSRSLSDKSFIVSKVISFSPFHYLAAPFAGVLSRPVDLYVPWLCLLLKYSRQTTNWLFFREFMNFFCILYFCCAHLVSHYLRLFLHPPRRCPWNVMSPGTRSAHTRDGKMRSGWWGEHLGTLFVLTATCVLYCIINP